MSVFVFIRPTNQFTVSLGQRLELFFHFVGGVEGPEALSFTLTRNGEAASLPTLVNNTEQLRHHEIEAIVAADEGSYTFTVIGT